METLDEDRENFSKGVAMVHLHISAGRLKFCRTRLIQQTITRQKLMNLYEHESRNSKRRSFKNRVLYLPPSKLILEVFVDRKCIHNRLAK